MEEMTEKELITVLIDKYTDLQRIKKANNNVENGISDQGNHGKAVFHGSGCGGSDIIAYSGADTGKNIKNCRRRR